MCGKEYPVLHHCVLVSNTNTTLHVWFVHIKVKGIPYTISTNFCTFSRYVGISRWHPRVLASGGNKIIIKGNYWLHNSLTLWFIFAESFMQERKDWCMDVTLFMTRHQEEKQMSITAPTVKHLSLIGVLDKRWLTHPWQSLRFASS